MQRTILVPVDFSKNALVAARYAIGFAEHSNYKLHFVHVYQPLKSGFLTEEANEDEKQEAKAEAETKIAQFREELGNTGGAVTSFAVTEGQLVKCLQQFIEEVPVAFIVMGTHGESGPRKDIMGSNTLDVSTSIKTPMVIVPESSPGFRLEQIVFFTDFQDGDITTLKAFMNITSANPKPVSLVHICEETEASEKMKQQELEDWKARLQQETGYGDLRTELISGDQNIHIIHRILDRLNADLTLLTLTGDRGFFDRLFYKSLAKAIVLNPRTPVLLTSAAD